MVTKYNKREINFKDPAIYRIVIQGSIDPQWSDPHWGLQVNISKSKDGKSITSMVGRINDQSALAGILSMLYDMQMTVISVNMLSEIES